MMKLVFFAQLLLNLNFPVKRPFTLISATWRRLVLHEPPGGERKANVGVRHVTRSWAELLGCASLFSPETAPEPSRPIQSPSCQTAKMTFAWKAAGLR
jgi:hypothetical protein